MTRVLSPRPRKPRILWEPEMKPQHFHMTGLAPYLYRIGTIGECDCGKRFVVDDRGWIQEGHTRSAGPPA